MAFLMCFAMPADAKNKDEAYQFLNYLLRPDVIAHISVTFSTPMRIKEATALVEQVRDNPRFIRRRMCGPSCLPEVQEPKIDRVAPRMDEGESGK